MWWCRCTEPGHIGSRLATQQVLFVTRTICRKVADLVGSDAFNRSLNAIHICAKSICTSVQQLINDVHGQSTIQQVGLLLALTPRLLARDQLHRLPARFADLSTRTMAERVLHPALKQDFWSILAGRTYKHRGLTKQIAFAQAQQNNAVLDHTTYRPCGLCDVLSQFPLLRQA